MINTSWLNSKCGVARQRGWNVEGLEINKDNARHMGEQGFKVFDKPLEECDDIADDQYDALVINQVLEHVRAVNPFLEPIKRVGFGFSASPVAADGKIYLSGEDGDIFVVRAGTRFELLARNPIGEPLMATPALSEGTMYVRGSRNVFAVGYN